MKKRDKRDNRIAYQSVIRNLDIIRRSNMVIFDEVKLIRDTAKIFRKIFDVVIEDHKKAYSWSYCNP